MAAGNWAGIAFAGLAFTGCATGPSLQVDPWDGRLAASVRTVSLAGGEPAVVLNDTYAEVPATAFSNAVLGLLADHGFLRADPGAADLWLRAHLLLKRGPGRARGAARGEGRHGGGRGGARAGGREGGAPEAEGRPGRATPQVEVVLELVRRASGEAVWTGTATARLAHPFWSPEGRQELVALAAQLLAPVHGSGSRT